MRISAEIYRSGENPMTNQIKCSKCRFVREDKLFSEPGWLAYECGHHDSELYRCLLNVSRNGDPLPRITGPGCSYFEREGANK